MTCEFRQFSLVKCDFSELFAAVWRYPVLKCTAPHVSFGRRHGSRETRRDKRVWVKIKIPGIGPQVFSLLLHLPGFHCGVTLFLTTKSQARGPKAQERGPKAQERHQSGKTCKKEEVRKYTQYTTHDICCVLPEQDSQKKTDILQCTIHDTRYTLSLAWSKVPTVFKGN